MTWEPPKVDEGILRLEEKIGLDRGFFASLLKEDDWSFVIKLHALFEAACTHLLLFHFKEPGLDEILSRLELSDKTRGKVAFLSKLELISRENRRLISSLSEVRNSLVHDVRNARFDLKALVAGFDAKQLEQFAVSFSPFESLWRRLDDKGGALRRSIDPRIVDASQLDKVVARAKADPKVHIWIGAYNVLVSIVEMYGYSDYKQWLKAEALFRDDE
jgi:hypothetical protein